MFSKYQYGQYSLIDCGLLGHMIELLIDCIYASNAEVKGGHLVDLDHVGVRT